MSINADLGTLMQIALADLIKAAPFATLGTALWIVIAYYFHQDMILHADQVAISALRQLFALESNPDLKATTNLQQLQAELADLENKIAEKALRRKAEAGTEQGGGKAVLPGIVEKAPRSAPSKSGAPADAPTARSTSAAMLTIVAISLMIVSFLIATAFLTAFG